jgi:hypothetical protein
MTVVCRALVNAASFPGYRRFRGWKASSSDISDLADALNTNGLASHCRMLTGRVTGLGTGQVFPLIFEFAV